MACNEDNNILIDDVLIRIIEHLSIKEVFEANISTVSQQFNRVVNKSLKSVQVINRHTIFGEYKFDAIISSSTMVNIIRKCWNCKHISLKDITIKQNNSIDDTVMIAITQNCNQLNSIDFDSLGVNRYIRHFMKNCQKIKTFASKKINDVSLDCVIESQFLESIDLRHNNNITGLSFDKFGENINELLIFSRKTITDTAINQLSHGNGKRIKKLSIYITSDNQFAQICHNFTQLTHLNFQFSHSIANLDKISKLINLTHLSLDVKYRFQFTANQFMQLIRSLNGKNMRAFEVTLDSPVYQDFKECIAFVSNNFPNLAKLSLNMFPDISDSSMSSISQLNNLPHLSLMNCNGIRVNSYDI